ncbi:hypothetical protein [Kineosporia succinea]|uniref:Pilus assembly protein Flp/PilA n=1 Tax=Kineosporia succinea TaxID=84632 RepID=A0ABT9P311_9ACTN|nr:hypothetical protein [Kineosporia succinea]MDP9826605.1 pilus assembly protein Flp/PilA [Kineosporia succinea]
MIQIYLGLLALGHRVRRRDDRGQTAAEYMGIVVIVAIIIVAIATSGIGTTIAGNITTKISQIFGAT